MLKYTKLKQFFFLHFTSNDRNFFTTNFVSQRKLFIVTLIFYSSFFSIKKITSQTVKNIIIIVSPFFLYSIFGIPFQPLLGNKILLLNWTLPFRQNGQVFFLWLKGYWKKDDRVLCRKKFIRVGVYDMLV